MREKRTAPESRRYGGTETSAEAPQINLGCGARFGFGGIVAFAVDRGNLAAHGTKVGGKLATMMDGVVHGELEIGSGG